VERSGFPLEMEVASTLVKEGWDVAPASTYRDRDQDVLREIDLVAHKILRITPPGSSTTPYSVEVELVIECKKSQEYVWVFLPQPRSHEELENLSWTRSQDFLRVIFMQHLLKTKPSARELFRSHGPFSLPSYIVDEKPLITKSVAGRLKTSHQLGISIAKFFRCLLNPNKSLYGLEVREMKAQEGKPRTQSKKDEIFEAIITLAKAIEWESASLSADIFYRASAAKSDYLEEGKYPFEYSSFAMAVILPLIIFDGKLCTWSGQNVTETKELLFEGRCHTEKYDVNLSMIVVRKEHLTEFIRGVNEDLARLAHAISLKRNEFDKETELILEGLD
jgi:hypothetical protein